MRSYFCIIIVFSFISCAVIPPYNTCEENKDSYKILNLHFKDFKEKPTLYYKTYGEDWSHYFKEGIVINRINLETYKRIIHIKDSLLLQSGLTLFQRDSIKRAAKEKARINIDTILSRNDIEYLSYHIQSNKRVKWNKKCFHDAVFSRKKETTAQVQLNLKKAEKSALFKKHTTRVSVPVFTKDEKIALFVVVSTGSETLFFYRKNENNLWEFYCSATLLIS